MAEELTQLEWQFQLYLSGLPIQDKAKFERRSDLSNFAISELALAFRGIRDQINAVWETNGHRIQAPEGDVVVHLDYIEGPIANAITFGSDGAYFVGITEAFLEKFAESSSALWQADFLAELFEMEMTEDVRNMLFQAILAFELQFISSHELGHLFHGHQRGAFRKEFSSDDVKSSNSRMREQAAELDADGYAVHLLLNGMLLSSNGPQIHARLGSRLAMEDCVLTLFLLSVGSLFYFMDSSDFDSATIRRSDHPFALARMNIVMDEIKSWCDLHLQSYSDWGSLYKFQWVMACVGAVRNSPERFEMWRAQGEFLESDEGKQYLQDLLTEKVALRRAMDASQWKLT